MDLSPARRKVLSEQKWAIQARQKETQEFINLVSELKLCKKIIRYYRKIIAVYIVNFATVEKLVDSKDSKQLQFVVYHDEKGDDLWVRWNEEVKRVKKPTIHRKSALSFPQRRK